ncbi:hypothetical protein V8D89_016066 [Ganoderma adspersum]
MIPQSHIQRSGGGHCRSTACTSWAARVSIHASPGRPGRDSRRIFVSGPVSRVFEWWVFSLSPWELAAKWQLTSNADTHLRRASRTASGGPWLVRRAGTWDGATQRYVSPSLFRICAATKTLPGDFQRCRRLALIHEASLGSETRGSHGREKLEGVYRAHSPRSRSCASRVRGLGAQSKVPRPDHTQVSTPCRQVAVAGFEPLGGKRDGGGGERRKARIRDARRV